MVTPFNEFGNAVQNIRGGIFKASGVFALEFDSRSGSGDDHGKIEFVLLALKMEVQMRYGFPFSRPAANF